ncbi:MAG: transglutaminase-like cysteine peptidase, partial [Plesiomonas shigelloides]
DYWASPLEFIGAGGGDCEDFSLAKYYSLRELGIADKQLRLVYVKALSLNQFHMVLAYYPQPSAMPLLLDNLNPKILPANQRMDLAPVYSFNASELWLQREHGVSETVGSADRLSRWREVKQRVEQQELQRPKIRLDATPL